MAPTPVATAPARATRPVGSFLPYRVVESGRALHEVLTAVNESCHHGYSSDFRFGAGAEKVVCDCLFQYDRLLRGLVEIGRMEFRPHREMIGSRPPPGGITCSIRHDVDGDIRAALSQAELEARHGVRSTYYILHTGPYYGRFDQGVFRRHGCMAILYRAIQTLGHEIALHTDGLGVYQQHGIDGAEALRMELEWLRSEGLDVVGTAAHNSASVYGAENYAIFKGRNTKLPEGVAFPPEAGKSGRRPRTEGTPLEVLDEAELGLTYEANDLFRQEGVPVRYGATRRANRWRWNLHQERLQAEPDAREDRFIDQDRLLADIAGLEGDQWLVLNVHPLYYGARHAPTSAPAFRVERASEEISEALGWVTYEPHSVQARAGDDAGRQEYQAINHTNEMGMLDVPKPGWGKPGELRVLVLGGTNLDGATTAMTEHATAQAAMRLRETLGRPVSIWKLAHPGMGAARLWGWLEAVRPQVRPHVVVIGVGADEPACSLPEHWSRATGFAVDHPPGEYLRFEDGRIRFVPRSAGAAICRRRPRPLADVPDLTQPEVDRHALDGVAAIMQHVVEAVRDCGAIPMLMLERCGESIGLWHPDTDAAERRAAWRRCRQALDTLAQRLDVAVIDPYERMLELPAALPSHWRATPQWNHTGQRLAGETLFDTLRGV
jgi:hypothetical protein